MNLVGAFEYVARNWPISHVSGRVLPLTGEALEIQPRTL